jgi:uncharacterized protein involved in exopolysaccharide biosynthesis
MLIGFVASVVIVSAAIVVMSIPRFFESTALIVVSGSIYDRQANGAQIAMVTEQLTSRSNLETLIGRYNLYAPVTKLDPTVQQFQKEIKFDTKYRSDSAGFPESFTVSYRHPDPAIAKQVVTDLVAIFDKANKTLETQAAAEAQRIKGEIAQIEARLGGAKARRIAGAAQSTAASRAAGAFEQRRAERNAIASTLETLRDRQFALEAQIADQRRLVTQQQEVVRNAPPPIDDTRSSSYGALMKRRAELEGQIQDYSSKFTDRYPKLVQAREQLAEINQRLAEAGAGEQSRAAAASPASQELRSLQRELSRMETELEVVRREIVPQGAGVPGNRLKQPCPFHQNVVGARRRSRSGRRLWRLRNRRFARTVHGAAEERRRASTVSAVYRRTGHSVFSNGRPAQSAAIPRGSNPIKALADGSCARAGNRSRIRSGS